MLKLALFLTLAQLSLAQSVCPVDEFGLREAEHNIRSAMEMYSQQNEQLIQQSNELLQKIDDLTERVNNMERCGQFVMSLSVSSSMWSISVF